MHTAGRYHQEEPHAEETCIPAEQEHYQGPYRDETGILRGRSTTKRIKAGCVILYLACPCRGAAAMTRHDEQAWWGMTTLVISVACKSVTKKKSKSHRGPITSGNTATSQSEFFSLSKHDSYFRERDRLEISWQHGEVTILIIGDGSRSSVQNRACIEWLEARPHSLTWLIMIKH